MQIRCKVIISTVLTLAPTALFGAPVDEKQARAPALTTEAPDDLQGRLEKLGVAPAEVEKRLASLDADETAELQAKLDTLPAGGTDTNTIGIGSAILIALLLIIFL